MTETVLQFGARPESKYKERPSSYVVFLNEEKQVLVVEINNILHLPGGGIDPGESPEEAAIRESVEEIGYEITNLQLIGKANQFLDTVVGPMNKMGHFFTAEVISVDISRISEDNHETKWIPIEEFVTSSAARDFQKWAVGVCATN